jgi:iron complex transport system substrate-binding protein
MLPRVLVLAALIAVLCSSCGFKHEPTGALPAFPVSLHDSLGREVRLDAAPQRIVSLDPGMTAALYALGAQKLLVGRSGAETYPKAALSKPVMVAHGEIDLHKVERAHADLILAPLSLVPNAVEATRLERKAAAVVYVVGDDSVSRVEAGIGQLGLMTDTAVAARQLSGNIAAAVARVHKAVAGQTPVSTFVDLGLFFTIDPGSLTADLLHEAGGTNVASEVDVSHQVTKPELRTLAPDAWLSQQGDGATLHELRANKKTAKLPAVTSGRVVQLPASVLNEDGPRIAQALAAIARALHPGITIAPG